MGVRTVNAQGLFRDRPDAKRTANGTAKVAKAHRKIKNTAFVVNSITSSHLHDFYKPEKIYSEIAENQTWHAPQHYTQVFIKGKTVAK